MRIFGQVEYQHNVVMGPRQRAAPCRPSDNRFAPNIGNTLNDIIFSCVARLYYIINSMVVP
jgi:hypothetical protein